MKIPEFTWAHSMSSLLQEAKQPTNLVRASAPDRDGTEKKRLRFFPARRQRVPECSQWQSVCGWVVVVESWSSGAALYSMLVLRRWQSRSRREAPRDHDDSECRGGGQRAQERLAPMSCCGEEGSNAKHVSWTGRQKSWNGGEKSDVKSVLQYATAGGSGTTFPRG